MSTKLTKLRKILFGNHQEDGLHSLVASSVGFGFRNLGNSIIDSTNQVNPSPTITKTI